MIEFRTLAMLTNDPGFADTPSEALIGRHLRYGKALHEVSNAEIPGLVILAKSRRPFGSLIYDQQGLRIVSMGYRRTPVALGGAAARWFHLTGQRPAWIAGDPFRMGLGALSAKRKILGPLQIQVHGDFGVLSPTHGGLQDRARWAVARHTLRHADSIRVVSTEQGTRLINRYGIDPRRVFAAPVPIDDVFLEFLLGAAEAKPPTVGYIGRLHYERGLTDWVKVAKELAKIDPAVRFVVIGDGPHRQRFLHELRTTVGAERVDYLGFLRAEALASAVSRLSLFLNTWRHESYGRAMIEAICLGTGVVAVRSPGAEELKRSLCLDDVAIKITDHPAQDVLLSIQRRINPEVASTRVRVVAFQTAAIHDLTSRWIQLAKLA